MLADQDKAVAIWFLTQSIKPGLSANNAAMNNMPHTTKTISIILIIYFPPCSFIERDVMVGLTYQIDASVKIQSVKTVIRDLPAYTCSIRRTV